MAVQSSEKSVLAALGVNAILTVVKSIAFFLTGSGAMLSEAIHSLADLMNQGLLYVGIKRGNRAADKDFQYGYGRERFVWALMSAVGIFFMGCAFTILHGIQALRHPEPMSSFGIALGVLGLSLILDLSVFIFAFRSLWSQKGTTPFFEFLKTEADPPEVAVLLEDGAACLGVLIAMSAIGLSALTGYAAWDAIGSILIGILLGVVAIWLIERNLKLLTGPRIPTQDETRVRDILRSSPLIESVQSMRTQAIDTETYDVELDVRFSSPAICKTLLTDAQQRYPSLASREDFEAFQLYYTTQVLEVIGQEIDDIERSLTTEDDAFRFVDIEIQNNRE
ncbi:MAG: cation diffusion facilitator family transporter [Bradymonadia bacterium]